MDNLITISKRKLNSILNKHKMWLLNDPKGKRADLRGADLREANLMLADLRWANLREANLRGADIRGADLYEADLRGANLIRADLRKATLYKADLRKANLYEANLRGADIRGADIREADLYEADLTGANLIRADLRKADLYEANLRGANLGEAVLYEANLYEADFYEADFGGAKLDWPLVCPEKGSFIGYKKCRDNLIVELEIPEDAYRCSATSKKCRCSKAKVLSITNLDGSESTSDVAVSKHNSSFVYRIGETVEVTYFDQNRWNECSTGIHFFMNREDAVKYVY